VSKPPSKEELDRVLQKILQKYPHTKYPKSYYGKEFSVEEEEILHHISQVKRDSNAGVPYCHMYENKGDFIDCDSPLLVILVVERLRLLASVPSGLFREKTARELVQEGFCDPVRLFVKQELHKKAKLDEGRTRLISSSSIVDEIVERILFDKQNKKEIENWKTCPSKPGIGFTDEDNEYVLGFFKSFRKLYMSDISGWDWCFQGWMFDFEIRCREGLSGVDPARDVVLSRLIRNRMRCLSLSVYTTSKGELYEQLESGIMNSGSYVTSSTNSRQRVSLAYLAGASEASASGDDCVETSSKFDLYDRYGMKVKEYEEVSNIVSFCSHIYDLDSETVYLDSWEKGLFNLLNSPPSLELLEQFVHEYRNSPNMEKMCSMILESGWISNSKANKQH